MYEEPMFWCSQLFLPGWTPPKTPGPQDDFTFANFSASFSSLMENAQQQQRQVRERMARAQKALANGQTGPF